MRRARTFKVEAKRSDKRFPMKSPEISRELGGYLLSRFPHLKVDVHNPDLTVMVEVRDFAAYVHGDKVPGAGGLPVGTSGRALNMLSAAFDSPVAAWRMARRGLALHHIHFASPPYTSERAKLKVKALAQIVSEWTGSCVLYVVPYTEPQEYIRARITAPRRCHRAPCAAQRDALLHQIAESIDCQAIVTGESLAQVASQTLRALACTDEVQPLPVLRPADRHGPRARSWPPAGRSAPLKPASLPYEDCCTIFTPPSIQDPPHPGGDPGGGGGHARPGRTGEKGRGRGWSASASTGGMKWNIWSNRRP